MIVFCIRIRWSSHILFTNYHSFRNIQCLLPLSTFLASIHGGTASDSISPHTFTRHSCEELQVVLPLLALAFLASIDGSTVSDSVQVPFKALSKETLKAL
jgi:hypothetical protein